MKNYNTLPQREKMSCESPTPFWPFSIQCIFSPPVADKLINIKIRLLRWTNAKGGSLPSGASFDPLASLDALAPLWKWGSWTPTDTLSGASTCPPRCPGDLWCASATEFLPNPWHQGQITRQSKRSPTLSCMEKDTVSLNDAQNDTLGCCFSADKVAASVHVDSYLCFCPIVSHWAPGCCIFNQFSSLNNILWRFFGLYSDTADG